MSNGHLDVFQYLHHFIFRIELNVWSECGMTDHNRPIEDASQVWTKGSNLHSWHMAAVLPPGIFRLTKSERYSKRETEALSRYNNLKSLRKTGFVTYSFPNRMLKKGLPVGKWAWNDAHFVIPAKAGIQGLFLSIWFLKQNTGPPLSRGWRSHEDFRAKWEFQSFFSNLLNESFPAPDKSPPSTWSGVRAGRWRYKEEWRVKTKEWRVKSEGWKFHPSLFMDTS